MDWLAPWVPPRRQPVHAGHLRMQVGCNHYVFNSFSRIILLG
jgi:hypothetical protein